MGAAVGQTNIGLNKGHEMSSIDQALEELRTKQREGVKFYVIRSEGFGKQKKREIVACGLDYDAAKTEEDRLTALNPDRRFGDAVYCLEREDYQATLLERKRKRRGR